MNDKGVEISNNRIPDIIEVQSGRGYPIVMTRYIPGFEYYDIKSRIPNVKTELYRNTKQEQIRGVILFGPAMAVRQGYYRYFLDYLSNQGYLVYSFDFTGIDRSEAGPIKNSDITLHDWIDDLQLVINWVLENYKDQLHQLSTTMEISLPEEIEVPLYYLCHSLGGQLFGFMDNQNHFEKFIGITSQNGYWRFYKKKYRYFFFWYLFVPVLLKLYGYFPSEMVGFGENLPPKVMRRWKKWCTSKNYFFDDPEFADKGKFDKYNGEILTLTFDDDPWATPEAVDDLYKHYTNAYHDNQHFKPEEFKLDEIGHLGFFRPKCVDLWNYCDDWLSQKD